MTPSVSQAEPKPQHTTLPWSQVGGDVVDPNGFAIVEQPLTYALNSEWLEANPDKHWGVHEESHRSISEEETEANAAFIVRAVNAHEALVEALTSLDRRLRDCGPLHTAEDAYDSFYQAVVAEALALARTVQS